MRDFSISTYKRKKVNANRIKVQRQPLNLRKYLRPVGKVLGKMFLAATGTALVGGLAFLAYHAVSSTTFFRVKTIEVSDTKRLTRDQILRIADVEAGSDLAHMNLKRMGDQLVQNPWIESVRIRRYFPDRLYIGVTEREPLAVVNMGYLYYLDAKGNVFKVLNQGDRLDYPIVTGFTEEDLSNDPNGTREALSNTCELLKILREKGAFILADVSEIHYDKGYGFTLFTTSGSLPVKIGSGDFDAKVMRFARIYRELMAQQPTLRYIDLDYNDKIVIKKS